MRRLLIWLGWASPYPYRETVIVNTKTKLAFRGVLWDRRGGFLVLRNAALLDKGAAKPIDGEAVIPAENVDFLQVLPAGSIGGA